LTLLMNFSLFGAQQNYFRAGRHEHDTAGTKLLLLDSPFNFFYNCVVVG
jgi:hypothetical protein